MSKIIELKGVKKTYPSTTKAQLRDVNFLALDGEMIVIIGPSGCGKTTLIKIIAGLEEATDGEIEKPEEVSMVFQDGGLFPWLSVADNIALPLKVKGLEEPQIKRKVRLQLDAVGLSRFAVHYPRELSGGQKQRAALARALAVEPKVLLLDEPFAALDIKTVETLHQSLLDIWSQTRTTMIMVSHSIEEAVTLADRVVLMHEGSVARTYHLADIERPRRDRAHDFIEQVNTIRRDFLALG